MWFPTANGRIHGAKIIRALILSQKWIQIIVAPMQKKTHTIHTHSRKERECHSWAYDILYGVENWLPTLFAFCVCVHKCKNALPSTSKINNTNKMGTKNKHMHPTIQRYIGNQIECGTKAVWERALEKWWNKTKISMKEEKKISASILWFTVARTQSVLHDSNACKFT